MKVQAWKDEKGWNVQVEGKSEVYVYQTMRSALKMVELILKAADVSKEE